jgi:FtsH-binding integral membrane protein
MSPPGAVAGTARRVDPAMLRVWGLIGVLAVAAIELTSTVLSGQNQYIGNIHIPWIVLAFAFAFCHATSVHFEVRRQAQGVQLSQFPLVLGFFFSSPLDVVSAAAAGMMLALL